MSGVGWLGWLYSSAEIVDVVHVSGTVSYKIPNSPSWLGMKFYHQVLHYWEFVYYDPIWGWRTTVGHVLSRGMVCVIGK
jgi:hypothetical protein